MTFSEKVTEEKIQDAVETLEEGGTVIYPTETVYGIGADALNPDAVSKVFEIKARSRSKPISLATYDINAAREYAKIEGEVEEFAERFLPGPATVIVPKKENVPEVLTAGNDSVGIRIPDHEVALELAERFGPITSTSANLSGKESARHHDELHSVVTNHTDVVLEADDTHYGVGSTVVSYEGEGDWEIVREGALLEEIKDWIEKS